MLPSSVEYGEASKPSQIPTTLLRQDLRYSRICALAKKTIVARMADVNANAVFAES